MTDRPLPACPLLRDELDALGGPSRLTFTYGASGCPCRLPPPGGPASPPEARPEALLCAAAAPGAPVTKQT